MILNYYSHSCELNFISYVTLGIHIIYVVRFFENFSIFFFLVGLLVFSDRCGCLRNVIVISELFMFCKSERGLLFFLNFCEVNSFSYLDLY